MRSEDARDTRPRRALPGLKAAGPPAGDDRALTFRALLADGAFRALWSGNAASVAAGTAQSLALSVWVYDRTQSAFLAASGLVVGAVPQLVSGLLLLSLADRIPSRLLLGGWPVVRALVPLALGFADVPVGLAFALVMAAGLGNAVEMASRLALLVEVVPEGAYALGRMTFNVTVGLMQVTGYAVGGALVVALGTKGAFLAAVAMNLLGAVSCLGLPRRKARATAAAAHPASLPGTRTLLASPAIRGTLLGHWLPNGLIVGAEALYVPYAGNKAGGLFVSAALGMAAGDLVLGRFAPPAIRARITGPLYVLLAAPYLAFLAHPGTWVAVALVGVASTGFGGTLGLNERLVCLLPETMRGRGLGLAGTGTVCVQAIAAAVAGVLADFTRPGLAMASMALASLLTTATLWRSLTRQALPDSAAAATAAGRCTGGTPMNRHGHPARIGLKLARGAPVSTFRRVWRIADEAGFDHCWAFDHLVTTGPDDASVDVFEGWTLLAAMAEATAHVRVGLLVSGMVYRHPALLAKQAVTVDHLSGGRLEFGIGAGWAALEHQMLGIGAAENQVGRFSEGLQLIRLLWTRAQSDFDGRYFRLRDAMSDPKPIQRPHPPIWVGAAQPAMIRQVAHHADVWNWAGDSLAAAVTAGHQLEAACREIGRDPAAIRWSAQFALDPADPATTIKEVRDWHGAGFTELIVSCSGSDPEHAATVAAEQILPVIRTLE